MANHVHALSVLAYHQKYMPAGFWEVFTITEMHYAF